MATNFPTGLDALTNPTATDTLASVPHADQHANNERDDQQGRGHQNGSPEGVAGQVNDHCGVHVCS